MNVEMCRDMLGDLSDYLDGQASQDICAEIERHMASCEDCRIVINTFEKTVLLYRDLPQPEVPDGARQRLYQALDLQDYWPSNR